MVCIRYILSSSFIRSNVCYSNQVAVFVQIWLTEQLSSKGSHIRYNMALIKSS